MFWFLNNSTIHKCTFDSNSNISQDSTISFFKVKSSFFPTQLKLLRKNRNDSGIYLKAVWIYYECFSVIYLKDMKEVSAFLSNELPPSVLPNLPPAVLPRDPKGGPGLRGQLERPPCFRTNTSGSLSFFLAGPISPIMAHRRQWRGNKTQMNSALVSHVRILNPSLHNHLDMIG